MSSVFVYAEPVMEYADLSRYRPESGLRFEKHTWLFQVCAQANVPLFEHVAGIVARDRRISAAESDEVPAADLVDMAALPSMTRVCITGSGVSQLLTALLQADDAIVYTTMNQDGNAYLESVQPRLYRLRRAQSSYQVLSEDPEAYLLSGRTVPMSAGDIRGLALLARSVEAPTLPIVEFGGLVAKCRWLASSLGSVKCPLEGVVLYGDGTLLGLIERASGIAGVDLINVNRQEASARWGRPPTRADIPRWEEVLQGDPDVLDVSGSNVAVLPPDGEWNVLELDDTAIVDLEPLRGWPRLKVVSLRKTRPLSLGPLCGVRVLSVGPADVDLLSVLPEFSLLEDLTIDGGSLTDLRMLKYCPSLRSVSLRSASPLALTGIETLDRLDSLTLSTTELMTNLSLLSELTSLRELRINVTGSFDLDRVPALRQLERLEISGRHGCSFKLQNVERLSLFVGLKSLNLSTSDVNHVEWIESLRGLRAVNLAATDILDISPLGQVPELEVLDISETPLVDLSRLANLSGLRSLKLPRINFSSGILAAMPHLRELQLPCCDTRMLEEASRLTGLQKLSLWGEEISKIEPLCNLPKLTSLDLSDTRVEDLSPLASLLDLRELQLVNCPITSVGPLERLSRLRRLVLNGSEVTDVEPISRNSELVDLSLSFVPLADLGPLASMTRLRRLELSGILSRDPPSLAALCDLRTLDISGSGIRSLEPLQGLGRLRELHAQHLTNHPDLGVLLDLPPLSLLRVSRDDFERSSRQVRSRLTARHHLVLASE